MNARSEKRGDKHSRRTLARLNAVQALYQLEHDPRPAEEVVEEFLLHRIGAELDGDQFKDSDKPLFRDIVIHTRERQAEIDALIADRLEKDRIDSPAKVLIKEYIGIARSFFTGKEPALVNGVLDKIAKELRPGEFG